MKLVTYNIQYGIGLDGQYDLGRIADAVRGADVIALQEVTRNNPQNGGRDMVAEIGDACPTISTSMAAISRSMSARASRPAAPHHALPVRQHGAVEDADPSVAQPAFAAQPQFRAR